MNPDNEISEFARYRLKKSDEMLTAAEVLYNANLWNSVINRLYYACFYAASAALLYKGIGAKSHTGVLGMIAEHFVKTKEISIEDFHVYSKLMNWRTKGDYGDLFDFSKDDVDMVFEPAKHFVDTIKNFTR